MERHSPGQRDPPSSVSAANQSASRGLSPGAHTAVLKLPSRRSYNLEPMPRRIVLATTATALVLVSLAGCGRKAAETSSQPGDPVLRARKEKDEAFKRGPDSPLRAEDKARFKALSTIPYRPSIASG